MAINITSIKGRQSDNLLLLFFAYSRVNQPQFVLNTVPCALKPASDLSSSQIFFGLKSVEMGLACQDTHNAVLTWPSAL